MKRVSINDVSDTAEIIENTLFFQRRTFLKDVFFMNPGAMKKAAFEQYIGHGDFALCSNLILGINRSISVVLLFVLAAYKNHNEEKKRGSLHSMQQSAALGCGRHEALMQQILTPVRGLN